MNVRIAEGRTGRGLRVVTAATPGRAACFASLHVRSGSRRDPAGMAGLARFAEHMAFRGSRSDPSSRWRERLEREGGGLDAGTTREEVFFTTPFPPEAAVTALSALFAVADEPLLDREAIELERDVILDELRDEYDDEGRDVSLENHAMRALFGDAGIAAPIAGTPASVGGVRRTDLVRHHEACFVAGNMVLAVAGPVVHEQILELADRHLPVALGGPRELPCPAVRPRFGGCVEVAHDTSLPAFRLTFPALPEHAPGYPAQLALVHTLDDGFGSRLPRELVERRGLLYRIGADVIHYEDVSLLEIEGAAGPEQVAPAVDALAHVLEEAAANGISADELERARNRWRARVRYGADSAAHLVDWCARRALAHRSPEHQRLLGLLDAVTTDDVRAIARAVLGARPSAALIGGVPPPASRALRLLAGD